MSRYLIRILQPMLFALMLVLSSTAFGANSNDQLEERLAGTEAREWVFQKFDTFMSAGKKCKKGESYRFKVDHTVNISRCVDGQLQDETMQWSIESDAVETRLKLGSTFYILKFWNTPKGHFMMLRTKASTKTEETVDKTFRLAEE
jgi:hypothetical protein